MSSLNVKNTLSPGPPIIRGEYGRAKVALPRGKGLLDWIQLSANKTLARFRQPSVTVEELKKHNTRDDCWVHLFGQVYDVTQYLEFHPGGIPELMRVAGRDASELFNKFHAWVNYESMLKACYVGALKGDATMLPPPGPSTLDNEKSNKSNSLATPGTTIGKNSRSTLAELGISLTSPSPNTLRLCSAAWRGNSLSSNQISWSLTTTASASLLRLLIRPSSQNPLGITWELMPSLRFVGLEESNGDGEVALLFEWEESAAGQSDGGLLAMGYTIKEKPVSVFHDARVIKILNHSEKAEIVCRPPRDCLIIVVEMSEKTSLPVPAGHHVQIRAKKGGSLIARSYTPFMMSARINASLGISDDRKGRCLLFMIKIYEDGIVTPEFLKLCEGCTLSISDPMEPRAFSAINWQRVFATSPDGQHHSHATASIERGLPNGADHTLMLAAGTGITPMLALFEYIPAEKCELVLFNKNEDDIPRELLNCYTRSEQEEENHEFPFLSTCHVLSEAGAAWPGARGRISRELIAGRIRCSADFVFLCGPDGFVQSAAKILAEVGHPSENVCIFQG